MPYFARFQKDMGAIYPCEGGYKRRVTRQASVGHVKFGGDAPIFVQSMTNTDTMDYLSTISQIRRLESMGCDIIRVAVPDMEMVKRWTLSEGIG